MAIKYNPFTGDFYKDASLETGKVNSFLAGGSVGNIVMTGYLAGPASFVIDPAAVGDNTGTVVIAGNLQVDGTTTTINSTELTIDDKAIVLSSGAADSSSANGSGIFIDGADASILYTSSNDGFTFNKTIYGDVTSDTVDINGGTIDGTVIGGTTPAAGSFTNVTITGGSISGITDLSVADGGTGASSFAANNVLLGNGTSSFQTVAPGTSGNVLTSNGTTWTSAAPTPGYTDADVDTHLNTGTASSGELLSWNGSDYDWIAGASPELYAENPDSPTAPSATGTNAVAIGSEAVASGTSATAFGSSSTASGSNSVAVGDSTASGNSSSSLGKFATASGAGSSAIGYGASATSSWSTAIGGNSSSAGSNAETGDGAMALGGSYASGADSFAAAIADNTSSYGATGANSVAIGYLSKSTGQSSFSTGYQNTSGGFASAAIGWSNIITAAGSVSFALGYANTVSGGYAATFGRSNSVTAEYGVATGYRAKADVHGKVAHSAGSFSSVGDAQSGKFVLRSDTTDATPEALTADNFSGTTQIILPNNSAYSFSGTIIARQQASAGSNYASWEIKGALLRDANAASTVLGNGIINKLYATSGASAWAVALSADTTNGGLKVEVTGAASTNIRWVATINTSEVTYA